MWEGGFYSLTIYRIQLLDWVGIQQIEIYRCFSSGKVSLGPLASYLLVLKLWRNGVSNESVIPFYFSSWNQVENIQLYSLSSVSPLWGVQQLFSENMDYGLSYFCRGSLEKKIG